MRKEGEKSIETFWTKLVLLNSHQRTLNHHPSPHPHCPPSPHTPTHTHLVIGEDPEDVQLCIRSKPKTLSRASNDSSYKCSMSKTIFKTLLVGPVCPIFHTTKMGMATSKTSVKYGHPHSLPRVPHAPEYVCLQCRGDLPWDRTHQPTTHIPVTTRLCACMCAEGGTGVETIPPSRSNSPPLPSLTAASWIEAFLGRLEVGGEREREKGCVTL